METISESTERRQVASRCADKVEFIKSANGVLKISQVITSMVIFSISVSSTWNTYGGGWINFVSITGFIQASIWFFLHIFNCIHPFLANHFIEVVAYELWTLLYFVAGTVAACKAAGHAGIIAAAFFNFVCTLLFAIDTGLQLAELRRRYKARNDRRSEPRFNVDLKDTGTTLDEDTIFVRPGSEKGFY